LLLFNTAGGPMKDVRVRKAVQLALDGDALALVLRGAGIRGAGLVPKGMLGYDSEPAVAQNLEEAAKLLTDAGYGADLDELVLTMTYAKGDAGQKAVAEALGAALEGLNVTLRAEPMAWDAQWARGQAKKQDIFAVYSQPGYADPSPWFAQVFRSSKSPEYNLSYLRNAEIDAMIDALPGLAATDRLKADAFYLDLQRKILRDEAAGMVPYIRTHHRALAAKVAGYVDNPAYPNVVFVYDLKLAV